MSVTFNYRNGGLEMSYKVTISGTVLEKCIEHVSFCVDTFNDGQTTPRNSIIITGQIDTEEGTAMIYKWALLSGANPDCYKEVTVEQYQKTLLVRKVTFSKAFVIDYSESYSNSTGTGTFTLYLRQFFAKEIAVSSEETDSVCIAVSKVANGVEEPVKEVQKTIAILDYSMNTEITKKTNMSFTERLAIQSDINELSNLSDDKLKEIFAKEIEQSKQAYSRGVKVKQQAKKKGCVASNGTVTLSGYGEKVTKSKVFSHVPLDKMFEYCKDIGHELPPKVPSSFDNGIEGSFFACHAEKQLSLLTDKPIGITNDMCNNCIGYFSKHAIASKQVKVNTDPKVTRIFFPNGITRELPKG